jgi:transcriptional regulator GlxA family with amidase domain
MKVYVLALEGVFDTGLSTVLDVLSTANELAIKTGMVSAGFGVQLVGVRRKVRTSQGLIVPVRLAQTLETPDAVLIPALGAKMPETLSAALERRDITDAGKLLRSVVAHNITVGTACTGSFVLAQAGLLDGQQATTSWWLAPMFRARYPNVFLDESRMLVQSANLVTAGAALAHLDLALWLVRHVSPSLATLVARYLLVEQRSSQAAFVIPDHLAHSDPLVGRFEEWSRLQLAEGFSLRLAAVGVGTSERTLARRLRAVLGKSPLGYFQDLRVERAVHLLQTTKSSVDQVAAQVGYADGLTLRALLKRKLGQGIRSLRARRL